MAVPGVAILRLHRVRLQVLGWLQTTRKPFDLFYRHYLAATLRKINTYHFGVLCCAWTSGIVLILNITITTWAGSKFGITAGIGTFQHGNCSRSSKLGFWIHLVINFLSTALLGASNYTMQCLSSPTRAEVDKAHANGSWLDIGLPSLTNIFKVARCRKTIWWVLVCTTIPLHLLWNSAVFSSLSSYKYSVWILPEDYSQLSPSIILDNALPDLSNGPALGYLSPADGDCQNCQTKNLSQFEKLDIHECLKSYIGPVISNRADVLLISSLNSTHFDSTGFIYGSDIGFSQYSDTSDGAGKWICNLTVNSKTCDLHSAAMKLESSAVRAYDIQHCWSERSEERCRVQFSLPILIVVIVCNAIKFSCMAWLLWRRDSEPLITIGDAIASFLNREDVKTRSICLATQAHFWKENPTRTQLRTLESLPQCSLNDPQSILYPRDGWKEIENPMTWKSKRRFWFLAASSWRLGGCFTMCFIALGGLAGVLALGLRNSSLPDHSLRYLYSLGFGTVTPDSTIASINVVGSWGLLGIILIVNTPQLFLSFVYLGYNSLFTSILLAKEWESYATHRKTLRVTSPIGNQRSTYWLQLPYRYSIPLLLASAALHWLVSQSIFLARVIQFDDLGSEDIGALVSTCGYSNIAIISFIFLGSLLVLIVLIIGFHRFQSKMPLAISCSAAISAACHPPEMDTDAAVKPVKWGVVDDLKKEKEACGVQHCTFTSFEVSEPVEGQLYA